MAPARQGVRLRESAPSAASLPAHPAADSRPGEAFFGWFRDTIVTWRRRRPRCTHAMGGVEARNQRNTSCTTSLPEDGPPLALAMGVARGWGVGTGAHGAVQRRAPLRP